ncbi:MAG: DnaJ-domain-containing protein 1 [Bradymonadia bacterium]|jgi:DnaJ-domain-containing protein 1
MNVKDALRTAREAARKVGRVVADAAMAQPVIRERVVKARSTYQDLREQAEERFVVVEAELWQWINRMQSEAQKAGRQAQRRKIAVNHYDTLGVGPDATMEEVKVAYRLKMREHHPDRFAHDPEAEAQAQERAQVINVAYQELTALLTGRESRRAD